MNSRSAGSSPAPSVSSDKKPYKIKVCPETGKRGFKIKAQAVEVLRRSREGGKPMTRIYRCPHCRKWHLTKTRGGLNRYDKTEREARSPNPDPPQSPGA